MTIINTEKHHFDIDGATIMGIVAGVVAITTAFLTGLWQWLTNKKKSELEEQTSLIAGFSALLTSIQGERDRLMHRVDECEISNAKLDRRIIRLERELLKHNIDIPDEEIK